MNAFIASDCTTTLPGNPADKIRHTPHGCCAKSVFIPRPQLVQDYYNDMPRTDIVNKKCTVAKRYQGMNRLE